MKCPTCGKDVEIFSTDPRIRCAACGFTGENISQSCYNWCRYADQCREDAKNIKLKI
jgi:hypothetical protein